MKDDKDKVQQEPPAQTGARIQAIVTSCLGCTHRRYNSGGIYYCEKLGSDLDPRETFHPLCPLQSLSPTQPAQEPDPVLCKFYQVTTFEELVSAQEHHINKLQAKLEKENDNGMGSILARKSRAASDQWSGCAVVGCVASESQTGQVAKVRQEQPASVDAYVGAREDAAIWKKRALEAEELNRKFIAELNGPTYLGEPVKQEQPAQEPVGRFLKATYGDYGVLNWHPSYVAKIGDCLYTHPAPTQPAPINVDVTFSRGDVEKLPEDQCPDWCATSGDRDAKVHVHLGDAQPAQLSDDEILNCFYASKSEGMAAYMLAVGRAIEAHCLGGQA